MQRLKTLWPQLVVAAYALIGITPLLRPALTCSDDGVFHMHKAVALEQVINAGHWFARWMPEMAQGYGYPHFVFYAPLGSYWLVTLHKLGLSYPAALHVAFALILVLAGWAVLALVRHWWGPWAGIAAAVAYISAPYFAFDILFRAALAESFALLWPPVVLYALHRALDERSTRWGVTGALAFAALIYTHNTTALVSLPLIGGYGLLLVSEQDGKDRLAALGRGLAIGLAGLGISARFWIPALFERALVQTDRLLVPPVFTYYTNFITVGELFAPPAVVDPLLINPSPAKGLGIVLALLAVAGWLTVLRKRPGTAAGRLWLFGGLLALYAMMMLAVSEPLWDAIPLVQFVQFPWRLAGPGMLCAAVLAGAAVDWWRARPWALAALIAVVAVIGHLSWWYPRYCSPFEDIDLAHMLRYEQATDTIGTSAKAEFLPVGVRAIPNERDVAEALIAGTAPTLLPGLPDEAVVVQDNDPQDFAATVTVASPTTLRFHQLRFPGWRVTVDGVRARLLADDGGLVAFALPAGTHTVRIWMGPTPLRAASDGVTLVTLACVLGVAAVGLREDTVLAPRAETTAARTVIIASVALPLLLLLAKVAVIDRTSNPLRHSEPPTVAATLPSGLAVGELAAPAAVASGDSFDATMLAMLATRTAGEYRPKFTLLGDDGTLWNSPNVGNVPRWHREPPPTWAWAPDHYAQWARREQVLPGTPPGMYTLWATVFDLGTLLPDGDPLRMGAIRVTRPTTPADPAALPIQYRLDDVTVAGLRLLGYNLDREQARPGDPLLVTLFWQATATMDADIALRLALQGGGSDWQLPPVNSYPTSQWQAGDVWRGQHLLRLPATLESGIYPLVLDEVTLRPLAVDAPTHSFAPPADAAAVGATFAGGIALTHAELAADAVTLTWQAATSPDTALHTFVHVVDGDGVIVAQHDGLPNGESRPSTGWLPGEFVPDHHPLVLPADLPPGDYRVLAGLADAERGTLLPADNSSDGRVPVGTVTVPAP